MSDRPASLSPSAGVAEPAVLAEPAALAPGSALPEKKSPEAELSARNSRLLLLGVAAYVALLSTLMILRGVAVTPDVLLLGLGLAAVVLGRGRLFLRDWVPFIALFFAYELMRGYADDLNSAVHVTDVIALERLLHLGALPTQVLQQLLHPATGTDLVAILATVIYFLHFPLPLAVGFLLWIRRRALYYDYVAALILLCLAGFATYLVLPVAPPWWAVEQGVLVDASGAPLVAYLKPVGFESLASALGFDGRYLYTYTFYQVAPNPVAAFPSLHAAFPFLAFLFARRAFGRAGWLVFGYFLLVSFSIVYLADHYLVDVYAGVAYAAAAAWAVIHAPTSLRRWLDRARDEGLEPGEGLEPADPMAAPAQHRPGVLRRSIDRPVLLQGLVVAALGALGIAVLVAQGAGTSLVALLPWAALLGGAWRAAAGLLGRSRA
jgi:hypothetical protein